MNRALARSQSKVKKRGFTLIELLVVIAIISILASILFPVFARARENARRASCMNNLKQIGLGMLQYTQDYDERYPAALEGAYGGPYKTQTIAGTPGAKFRINGTTHVVSWMDMVFPYVKSVPIFECPSQPDSSTVTNTVYKDSASYGYSGAISGYSWQYGVAGSNQGRMLTQVMRPAEVAMLIDFQGVYNNQGLAYAYTTRNATVIDKAVAPHFDGTNIAFADGHVKWLGTSQIIKTHKNTTPSSATVAACANNPTTCVWQNPLFNPFIN